MVSWTHPEKAVSRLNSDALVTQLPSSSRVEHLHYDLIHAEITVNDKNIETYLCVSEDFKKAEKLRLHWILFMKWNI